MLQMTELHTATKEMNNVEEGRVHFTVKGNKCEMRTLSR